MSDPSPTAARTRVAHIDTLGRVAVEDIVWRPIRRALGVTAFGVNAYTGDRPGDPIIELHDESSPGSGRHEELYVVLAGHAAFTVEGEAIDAPAGTFVLVPPGVPREAHARAAATTVLVVGGRPGAGLPASPFEHWYAALPALAAGDPAGAAAVAAEGLADHPDHGGLHYQLACFRSLAGERDAAVEHLRRAVDGDPRTWDWAAGDADLDPIREHPGFPRRRTVDGVHVEDAGAGPAVVLIHAGIADSRMFGPQWATWPARRRVVRLDLRGFGGSPPPAGGDVVHGADVLAAMDALGIERAALVGCSLGGLVALDVACARPDRVSALVLAGSAMPGHQWSQAVVERWDAEEAALARGDLAAATEVNVTTWLDGPRRGPADVPARIRELVSRMQLHAFQLAAGAEPDERPLCPDLAGRLCSIAAPALVVTGDEDVADIGVIAERLQRELPAARRATVAGAAHLPSLERPEAFDALVLPFLAEVGA